MDDMSDVVEDMFTDFYTVTRRSPSAYVLGKLQPSTTSTLTISACVQPIAGIDLQRLPEGMRVDGALSLWTTTPLFTKGPAQDPDFVAVEGETFEVATVEPWGMVGNYYKAILQRMGH